MEVLTAPPGPDQATRVRTGRESPSPPTCTTQRLGLAPYLPREAGTANLAPRNRLSVTLGDRGMQ